jgi:hypothetical protein
MIKLAVRNLTRRRARTLLTILGVTVAVSFTAGLLSISEGFIASFNERWSDCLAFRYKKFGLLVGRAH